MSYGNRRADLFFEVFPNASCLVTLIDRLVHRSEIIAISADSYRLKEPQERALRKAQERAAK